MITTEIPAETRIRTRRRTSPKRMPLGCPDSSPRLRIAVADGDEGILEVYPGLLKILGHDVVSLSQSGYDLADRCRTLKPDLVLVEKTLPDADGLDIAEEILQHRLIPIVLVTPGRSAAYTEQSLRRGVLATLAKPFRLAELREAIAHARRCFDQLDTIRQCGLRLNELLKR